MPFFVGDHDETRRRLRSLPVAAGSSGLMSSAIPSPSEMPVRRVGVDLIARSIDWMGRD